MVAPAPREHRAGSADGGRPTARGGGGPLADVARLERGAGTRSTGNSRAESHDTTTRGAGTDAPKGATVKHRPAREPFGSRLSLTDDADSAHRPESHVPGGSTRAMLALTIMRPILPSSRTACAWWCSADQTRRGTPRQPSPPPRPGRHAGRVRFTCSPADARPSSEARRAGNFHRDPHGPERSGRKPPPLRTTFRTAHQRR